MDVAFPDFKMQGTADADAVFLGKVAVNVPDPTSAA